MVIDSLNLKLRQIARFSSNVVLDEVSSAKCRLLQHEERPLYHIHMVTSRFIVLPFDVFTFVRCVLFSIMRKTWEY